MSKVAKKDGLDGAPHPILVTGGESTATSSVTMLINSDPRAFVLFEAPLTGDHLGRRARALLSAFPDARRFFGRYVSPVAAYEEFRIWLQDRGFDFDRVGVKEPSLDPCFLNWYQDADIVYCVRDVRTWLPQPRVIDRYAAWDDVVPLATTYLHQLIVSCTSRRCTWVRTEDYATDLARVAKGVGEFLSLSIDGSAPWQGTLALPSDHPKVAIGAWWTAHQSSLTHEERVDTTVTLRPHPFWDDFLPLFDHYYNGVVSQNPPEPTESHLRHLERVRRTYSVPLSDAYVSVHKSPLTRRPPRWRRVGYHVKRALAETFRGS